MFYKNDLLYLFYTPANVVSVMSCLYSVVSLTLVRQQCFMRMIYYYICFTLQQMVQNKVRQFSGQAASTAELVKGQISAVAETLRSRNPAQSSASPQAEGFSDAGSFEGADTLSEDFVITKATDFEFDQNDVAAPASATASSFPVESHAPSKHQKMETTFNTTAGATTAAASAAETTTTTTTATTAAAAAAAAATTASTAAAAASTAATTAASTSAAAAAATGPAGGPVLGTRSDSQTETMAQSLKAKSQAGPVQGSAQKQTFSTSSSAKKNVPIPPAQKVRFLKTLASFWL